MSENDGGGGSRRGAQGQGAPTVASSPEVGRAVAQHRLADRWLGMEAASPPDCVARLSEGAQVRRADCTNLLPPSLGEIQAIQQVGLTPQNTLSHRQQL